MTSRDYMILAWMWVIMTAFMEAVTTVVSLPPRGLAFALVMCCVGVIAAVYDAVCYFRLKSFEGQVRGGGVER